MAPVPTGTASCMYRPRRRTMRTASAKAKVPAATCAEYSPRLCPATICGAHPARLEQPGRGDADRQDGRLGVLGEHEAVLGTVEAQLAERLAQRRIRLVKHRAALGVGLGQRATHADFLRALPWKHEGDHVALTGMAAMPRSSRSTSRPSENRCARPTAFSTAVADERPCPTMTMPLTPSSRAPPYSAASSRRAAAPQASARRRRPASRSYPPGSR